MIFLAFLKDTTSMDGVKNLIKENFPTTNLIRCVALRLLKVFFLFFSWRVFLSTFFFEILYTMYLDSFQFVFSNIYLLICWKIPYTKFYRNSKIFTDVQKPKTRSHPILKTEMSSYQKLSWSRTIPRNIETHITDHA